MSKEFSFFKLSSSKGYKHPSLSGMKFKFVSLASALGTSLPFGVYPSPLPTEAPLTSSHSEVTCSALRLLCAFLVLQASLLPQDTPHAPHFLPD